MITNKLSNLIQRRSGNATTNNKDIEGSQSLSTIQKTSDDHDHHHGYTQDSFSSKRRNLSPSCMSSPPIIMVIICLLLSLLIFDSRSIQMVDLAQKIMVMEEPEPGNDHMEIVMNKHGFLTKVDGHRHDDHIERGNIGGDDSGGDDGGGGAAICAIQKDGLPYVDEWVDYHIALGFEKIYIYDNSNDFELKEWFQNNNDNGDKVQIKHYPAVESQVIAYTECGQFIKEEQLHSWIAFIDLDEFINIRDTKKYPFIMDLLNTLPADRSGLVMNWDRFFFDGQTKYEPRPVLLRFQRREPVTYHLFKTIARVDHFIDMSHPHYVNSKHYSTDSSGSLIVSPSNKKFTNDTIVIFHIYTKSVEEYKGRCKRGRADASRQVSDKGKYCQNLTDAEFLNIYPTESVLDDSAWALLKERVPKYANFEK